MDVSVIIPHHNRAAFLKLAIESVLKQKRKPREVIVVDDASDKDESERAFQVFIDLQKVATVSLFWLSLPENKGVSAARNRGARHATSSWLAFLDSDDQWLPEKLKIQEEEMIKRPDILLWHSNEIWIRRGVRVNQKKHHAKKGGDIFLDCLEQCKIGASTSLIQSSFFWQLGGWDEDFIVCEDYDLWLRATSRTTIGFTEKALIYKFGGHEDQLSTRFAAMDYWRIKALRRLKKWRDLSLAWKIAVDTMIVQKSQVLLNGHKKHQKIDFLDQVLDWEKESQDELEIFQDITDKKR
jgi:glycosyltransferase involved in cell wall biosynthesis